MSETGLRDGTVKRYTARMRCQSDTPDAGVIRRALDHRLLYTSFAYELGAVGQSGGGELLFEVATDATREAIAGVIRSLEPELRVRVEAVGWGWLLTERAPRSASTAVQPVADPYASHPVQVERSREYAWGFRLKARVVGEAGYLTALVADALLDPSRMLFTPWLLLVYAVPLVLLSGPGLLSYPYVSRVRCDEQGIEVRYWPGRSARRLAWREVLGLDLELDRGRCVVLSTGASARLPVDSFAGPPDRLTLVKTIVERASLRFVEAVPLHVARYRRFDAP